MAEEAGLDILIGGNENNDGTENNEVLPTFGIVYNDELNARFFYFYQEFAPFRLPQSGAYYIPCSSSHGLVAFFDTRAHSYIIGNPFAVLVPNASQRYVALPLTRTPHDYLNTEVVLATDVSNPDGPTYHLVCACRGKQGNRFINVYSSELRCWRSFPDLNLGGRRLVLGTGVSCGRYVFWLTEHPRAVFRFDIDRAYGLEANFHAAAVFWPLPVPAEVLEHPQTRLQLGRAQGKWGLVIVNGAINRVEIYIFEKNGTPDPEFPRFLKIELRQDANNIEVLGYIDNTTHKWCTGLACSRMPRPVRFESDKTEMLLWVDDRMVVWEEWPQDGLVKILPATGVRPHLVQGFAHVRTLLLPGHSLEV